MDTGDVEEPREAKAPNSPGKSGWLSCTQRRYLLAIYRISQKTGEIHAIQVARALGVSKPSVAAMLDTLMAKGLVEKKPYSKISLTAPGMAAAQKDGVRIAWLMNRMAAMELVLSDDEAFYVACALAQALPERIWEDFPER